jgi:hypothetical protein
MGCAVGPKTAGAPAVSGEPFYQPGMSRSGPGFLLDLLFDRMIHTL